MIKEKVSVREPSRRIFDISASFLALIALFPLFLAAVFATWLASGRPVFFSQNRVGQHQKVITIHKIRTMKVGADLDHSDRALRQFRERGTFFLAGRNDSRVTPVGRIIRRSSIDEYPQLLSVIRGDMSLVGPRPMLLSEVEFLDEKSKSRFSVKPGLTGLWQVSGRKNTSSGRAMELDTQYVISMSARLDWEIILRTPWAMLSGRGAE